MIDARSSPSVYVVHQVLVLAPEEMLNFLSSLSSRTSTYMVCVLGKLLTWTITNGL